MSSDGGVKYGKKYLFKKINENSIEFHGILFQKEIFCIFFFFLTIFLNDRKRLNSVHPQQNISFYMFFILFKRTFFIYTT